MRGRDRPLPLQARLSASVLAASLWIVPSAAHAQPGDPAESEARARVRGLVEAVSSADVDGLHAFLLENLAPSLLDRQSTDEWRTMAARLIEDLSPLEIDEVRREGDEVTLEGTANGDDVVLVLLLDPASGERIADFGVEKGGPGPRSDLPSPQVEPGLAHDELGRRLDAWLETLEREAGFSGTLLVARDGKPVYQSARGHAELRYDVPNTTATRFDVGSINKDFTRVAIGQLVATGRLSFDDTIGEHLPDYPNAEARSSVTVAHLLEHSSGIGDIFGPEFFDTSKLGLTSPSSYFRFFAEEPLQFEPGSRRSYSNGGYMVLGAILEAVTGRSFHDYVRSEVFERAGMTATDFLRLDGVEPNVAIGYSRRDFDGTNPEGEPRSNVYHLAVIGSPAGSAFATASDLLAFDEALRESRLLPPAWTEWYFTGEVDESARGPFRGEAYAIGVAGGAPGVSAIVESDGRLAVIVLTNVDDLAEAAGLALYRSLAGDR